MNTQPLGPHSPQPKSNDRSHQTRSSCHAENNSNGGQDNENTVAPPQSSTAPIEYPWGAKTWLKRKEILWEYGLSPRSVRRLEQRGLLVPSKIFRHCLYKRADIEACLEEAK